MRVRGAGRRRYHCCQNDYCTMGWLLLIVKLQRPDFRQFGQTLIGTFPFAHVEQRKGAAT